MVDTVERLEGFSLLEIADGASSARRAISERSSWSQAHLLQVFIPVRAACDLAAAGLVQPLGIDQQDVAERGFGLLRDSRPHLAANLGALVLVLGIDFAHHDDRLRAEPVIPYAEGNHTARMHARHFI